MEREAEDTGRLAAHLPAASRQVNSCFLTQDSSVRGRGCWPAWSSFSWGVRVPFILWLPSGPQTDDASCACPLAIGVLWWLFLNSEAPLCHECPEANQKPRGSRGCGQPEACTWCPAMDVGTEVTGEWHSAGIALNLFVFLSKPLQTLLRLY